MYKRQVGPKLQKVSPHFKAEAKAVGGALFRIHNDQRFGKKPPYKTHVGIQFRHEAGKDVRTPGFYLHVEKGGSFIGLGIWQPPTPIARNIRQQIADYSSDYKKAVQSKAFREKFEIRGESLKRVPKEFDPEHPLGDHLRKKSFIAVANLTDAQVLSDDLVKTYMTHVKAGKKFVEFLCVATNVDF